MTHETFMLNQLFYAFLFLGVPALVFAFIIVVSAKADQIRNKHKQNSDTIPTNINKDDFSAMPCPYCGAPLNGRVNFVVTCSSCGMKTKLK